MQKPLLKTNGITPETAESIIGNICKLVETRTLDNGVRVFKVSGRELLFADSRRNSGFRSALLYAFKVVAVSPDCLESLGETRLKLVMSWAEKAVVIGQ